MKKKEIIKVNGIVRHRILKEIILFIRIILPMHKLHIPEKGRPIPDNALAYWQDF